MVVSFKILWNQKQILLPIFPESKKIFCSHKNFVKKLENFKYIVVTLVILQHFYLMFNHVQNNKQFQGIQKLQKKS